MPESYKEHDAPSSQQAHKGEIAFAFIAASLALAALLKQKKISCALRFYPSGGYGLNIYKFCDKKSKPLRQFAIDYHPFWNKDLQSKQYCLHYHRGETSNQMKKHRPYEGGW